MSASQLCDTTMILKIVINVSIEDAEAERMFTIRWEIK